MTETRFIERRGYLGECPECWGEGCWKCEPVKATFGEARCEHGNSPDSCKDCYFRDVPKL